MEINKIPWKLVVSLKLYFWIWDGDFPDVDDCFYSGFCILKYDDDDEWWKAEEKIKKDSLKEINRVD